MLLKTKIEDCLSLLETDKNKIKEVFIKWMKFIQITDIEDKIEDVERPFNKILIKIKNIENTLEDDLESNYENFLEFFKVVYTEGCECYDIISNCISLMVEVEEEHKLESKKEDFKFEEGDNEVVSLEKLVEATEMYYFSSFKLEVFNFYNDMNNILDEVFVYSDKLYLHYGGDEELMVRADRVTDVDK